MSNKTAKHPMQRVIKEAAELEKNLVKLCNFTKTKNYRNLSQNHQVLLCKQLHAMIKYRDILNQRITLFKKESI